MADIFVTEEYIDGVEEEYAEIEGPSPQVEADENDETVESQKCLDDNLVDVKEAESESSSDMTLKQGEQDDQLVDDGLLFKPGDLPLPVAMLEKYVNSDITFNRISKGTTIVSEVRTSSVRHKKFHLDLESKGVLLPALNMQIFAPYKNLDLSIVKSLGKTSLLQGQKVVHNLLETLRLVQGNKDEVNRVIHVLCTLSDDYDPIVRSELMGQFPYIASYCNENGLGDTVQEYLLPILVSYLGAENAQVRKAAQSALLAMVEQKLIDTETVTEKICCLVVHLMDSIHPEELRIDSVQLMGKLAVQVGKKVTEELFLPRVFLLCVDHQNYIRKACASCFGDICTTVGTETTEELLLPKFIELCKDATWSVRKACAESFMAISSVVSREVRCNELTNIYMVLLKDQSRWVRVTAYQGLGPFISTFAEPYKTGLLYKEGELVICDVQKLQETVLQIINKKSKNVQSTENSSEERTCDSEPCDSIVPLSCSETSLTASEIPGIPCYVGSYSTVIDESCPVTTAQAAKDRVADDTVSVPPIENGSQCLSQSSKKISSVNWCKTKNMVNHLGDIDSEGSTNETPNGWCEPVLKNENSLVNGDCSDFSDELNYVDHEKIKVISSQNSITVNGISVDTSETLSEPLTYETLPLVNFFNKIKQKYQENDDIEKVNNIYSSAIEEHVNVSAHTPGAVIDSDHKVSTEQNSNRTEHSVDESAFNHFQYWRTPIPDIDVDSLSSELSNSNDKLELDSFNSEFDKSRIISRKTSFESSAPFSRRKQRNYFYLRNSHVDTRTEGGFRTSENEEGEPPPDQKNITVFDQDIVPPELLLCYLNMIDAAWTEVAHYCAYSLPAVAITLGRKFWPCLKETFDALSSDLQGFIMMWKVRRTVASSMHQLAVILGPEITSRDLLPVFSRFIKDLDEVRIGILQHMSEFLEELSPEERKQFLPSLSEFLVSNSDSESKDKNWRFRLILAEQLVSVADLYEPEDVKKYLVPLSLTLIRDKICEVRLAAVRVMAAVMKRMSQHPTPVLTKEVLLDLTEKFINSPKWFHRQLYVYICQELIVQNSLPPDQFAADALPQLLYLCWDRVPNVRIAIARCLAVIIWPLESFSSPDSPHRELLLQTIHTLQSDLDVDVQFYANMVSTHECSCLQHGEFTNLGELPV